MHRQRQGDNLNCPSEGRKGKVSLAWHLPPLQCSCCTGVQVGVKEKKKKNQRIFCSVMRKMWRQKCPRDRLPSAFSHSADLTASRWSHIIIKGSFTCWECRTGVCWCFNKEKIKSHPQHCVLFSHFLGASSTFAVLSKWILIAAEWLFFFFFEPALTSVPVHRRIFCEEPGISLESKIPKKIQF